MSQNSAKVSILMPVYNEEKYIVEAIKSVLSQTERNFQLIIVNDGSSDSTQSLIEKIHDSRVKIVSPGKVGKNAAFNIAYNVSNSDWCVFFAGDDIMPPESIEHRINGVINLDPKNYVACFGQLLTFSEDKSFSSVKVPKNSNEGIITGGTMMFSKGLADLVFPIPENLPNEDSWTKLIIEHFAFKVSIPHIVLNYRIHAGNSISRYDSFDIFNVKLHDRNRVYNEFIEKFGSRLSKEELSSVNGLIDIENHRFNGDYKKIILSSASWKTKARFLAHSNRYLYKLRMSAFGLFSGWGE